MSLETLSSTVKINTSSINDLITRLGQAKKSMIDLSQATGTTSKQVSASVKAYKDLNTVLKESVKTELELNKANKSSSDALKASERARKANIEAMREELRLKKDLLRTEQATSGTGLSPKWSLKSGFGATFGGVHAGVAGSGLGMAGIGIVAGAISKLISTVTDLITAGIPKVKANIDKTYQLAWSMSGEEGKKGWSERKKIAAKVINESKEADLLYGNESGTTAQMAINWNKAGGSMETFDPELYSQLASVGGTEMANAAVDIGSKMSAQFKDVTKGEIKQVTMSFISAANAGSMEKADLSNVSAQMFTNVGRHRKGTDLVRIAQETFGLAEAVKPELQGGALAGIRRLFGQFEKTPDMFGKGFGELQTGDKISVIRQKFKDYMKANPQGNETSFGRSVGIKTEQAQKALTAILGPDFEKRWQDQMKAQLSNQNATDLETAAKEKSREGIVMFNSAIERLQITLGEKFIKSLNDMLQATNPEELKKNIEGIADTFGMLMDSLVKLLYNQGIIDKETLSSSQAEKLDVVNARRLADSGASVAELDKYKVIKTGEGTGFGVDAVKGEQALMDKVQKRFDKEKPERDKALKSMIENTKAITAMALALGKAKLGAPESEKGKPVGGSK